jgi:hypothetical protein
MSNPSYKPSEKAVILSAPQRDLGPEFRAGQVSHELERNKSILRNPKATQIDRDVAAQRIQELADFEAWQRKA